ncbi:protein-disulfide isomerase [Staphylococcus equorum]|uniref:DsbA family protein n=1 Tax=Staphylococcus equorum TaxID=246432 RepID=UPI000D1C5EC7|nr:DsbA family protein [Staphylococcus equorum]PTE40456.1 protein-disulfide isomerase [Staphylococcus equorum]PTE83499.1 protein-disulfide isomerase [Staphylococcus equorum]PTF12832.1 protein-disulfide isomerase [Staphylococcus equorum]RIL46048.1 DsbA family protein [Staphylococcus equorum]
MKKLWLCLGLIATMLLITACSSDEDAHKDDKQNANGKIKIIEYGDFKCSYCKKVESNIMPKLKKDYIDRDKVDYEFVNMAFLGDDSIIGSRAGHAVQQIAPKQYLDFQKLMFEQQGDAEKKWITESLVDKQIDKLSIDNKQKEKIKKDYKTEDSKSWKAAQKDKKQAEDKNIDTAPTVYIGGEKVEDPYDYDNYKKLIEKNE